MTNMQNKHSTSSNSSKNNGKKDFLAIIEHEEAMELLEYARLEKKRLEDLESNKLAKKLLEEDLKNAKLEEMRLADLKKCLEDLENARLGGCEKTFYLDKNKAELEPIPKTELLLSPSSKAKKERQDKIREMCMFCQNAALKAASMDLCPDDLLTVCEYGDPSVLRYFLNENSLITDETFLAASRNGNIPIAKQISIALEIAKNLLSVKPVANNSSIKKLMNRE